MEDGDVYTDGWDGGSLLFSFHFLAGFFLALLYLWSERTGTGEREKAQGSDMARGCFLVFWA